MESCRVVNLAVALFTCKQNEFQPNTVLTCSSLPSSPYCVHANHSVLHFSYSSYYRYISERVIIRYGSIALKRFKWLHNSRKRGRIKCFDILGYVQ